MPQNDVAEFIGGPRDGEQITLPVGATRVSVPCVYGLPEFMEADTPEVPSPVARRGLYAVRLDHGLRARRPDGVILLDWKGER